MIYVFNNSSLNYNIKGDKMNLFKDESELQERFGSYETLIGTINV